MTPLISAIVSTYNAAEFLPGCLNDLQNQSIASQLEIIVVDSGSLQNEGLIVREFQTRFNNIQYYRTEKRETVYAAWNRGISMARGRYITNANTDDRHRSDAYERMAAVLNDRLDIAVVYADLIKTATKNETFEKCTPIGRFRWHDWNRYLLITQGCFIGPQPMWRRSVHDLYGHFEESLVTSGDYEFWLRISQTLEFHHLRETLGLYLESPGSIEHRNREHQTVENRRILCRYKEAAAEGMVLGLKPLDELGRILRNGSDCVNKKLMAAFDSFELLCGIKGKDPTRQGLTSASEKIIYFEIKNKILQGDRSPETISKLLRRGSQLLLSRTEWYPRFSRSQEKAFDEICSADCKHSDNTYTEGNDRLAVEKAYEAVQTVLQASPAEGAILALRNIISLFPNFGRGHNDLALLMFQAGQKQEALQHYEEAVRCEPGNIIFLKTLAEFYLTGLGRAEDALKVYVDTLKTHPEDIDTLIAIGRLCQLLGQGEDARVFFERVLEIEPWNTDARSHIQQMLNGGSKIQGVPGNRLFFQVIG